MRDDANSSGANTAMRAMPAKGPTRSWIAHLELRPIPRDGAGRPSELQQEQYPCHRHRDSTVLFPTEHDCRHICLAKNSI